MRMAATSLDGGEPGLVSEWARLPPVSDGPPLPASTQQRTPGALTEAAAEALGRGRPDVAVAYLRRALRDPLAVDDQVTVLLELGRAEAYMDLPAAIEHLTEAAQRSPTPSRYREATGELAGLLALHGRGWVAAGFTDHAEPAETGSVEYTPHLAEVLLQDEVTARPAVTWLDEVAAQASRDDPRLSSLLAAREAWRGCAPVAEEMAEQTLASAALQVGDAPAYLRAALVLADLGRLEDARSRCDILVEAAQRWGHVPILASAHSARSIVGRRLGTFADALEDARTGLEMLLGCGADPRAGASAEFLARLVHVLVDIGRPGEAVSLLERVDLTGELHGEVRRSRAAAALLFARGRLRLAEGRLAQAVRDLLAAGRRLTAWTADNSALMPWRSEAATALLRLGDRATAHRYAAEEVELAREWGADWPIGRALYVEATVVGGPRALGMLEESLSMLAGSTAQADLVRCQIEYGAALHRTGRAVAARRLLHTALDLAQQCQSPVLVERARIELAAAGGRRPKARLADSAGLTAAERRTATLAAAGKTNRQIAEALFVERRTVEIHLTNAYRKLGIAGREELPSALRRSTPRLARG
jgi:DNA-binding CsgD family transcriptional regulator